MQHRRMIQGIRHTIGMCQLLGQRNGFMAPLLRLLGIAQIPEGPSGIAPAVDPLALAREADGPRAVPRGIIESHPLFQVRSRRGEHSQVEQGLPQRNVGLHQACGLLRVLGETEHLLRQLPGLRQLPSHFIHGS